MTGEITISAGDATLRGRGAESISWKLGGRELLWTGSTAWPRSSPLLFPVVGRSVGGEIRVAGQGYPMDVHGFAAAAEFSVTALGEASVTFPLSDTPSTRRHYPFAFGLEVSYRLTPLDIFITLKVVNPGKVVMPFAIGLHPGFRWPFAAADAGGHAIVFDQDEHGIVPVIDANGLFTDMRKEVPLAGRRLPLTHELLAQGKPRASSMPAATRSASCCHSARRSWSRPRIFRTWPCGAARRRLSSASNAGPAIATRRVLPVNLRKSRRCSCCNRDQVRATRPAGVSRPRCEGEIELSPVSASPPYDLILKGGWLIDPRSRIQRRRDIAIKDGRIAAAEVKIDANLSARCDDVSTAIVIPGMIDLHSHVHHVATIYGVEPDPVTRRSAASTMVDAGSAGAGNFAGLRTFVAERSQSRILAYLNISYPDIFAFDRDFMFGEASINGLLSVDRCVEVAQRNRDMIVRRSGSAADARGRVA